MSNMCLKSQPTAKQNVENMGGLLNNMACAMRHHLIKAKSQNSRTIAVHCLVHPATKPWVEDLSV